MSKPERDQVYKCDHCGNIAEIVHGGGAPLFCCGAAMTLQVEQTADKTTEKHVPMIEKIEGGYKVIVGSTAHPMIDKHYIEWIELITEDKVYRQYLKPEDKPEAEFKTDATAVSAREYCNLHGLWKS